MADYVYPVNDRSDSWGDADDPSVQQYFSTMRTGKGWYLSSCFKMIEPGDRIWAYATAPLQQIVGVGAVIDGPYEREWSDGSIGWAIDIKWDLRRDKKLVRTGPRRMFDRQSVPQHVRRAKLHEVKTLMRAYNAAGK